MSEHELKPFEVGHGADPELPWQQVSFGHHDPAEFARRLNETYGSEYEADDVSHEWWLEEITSDDPDCSHRYTQVEEGTEGAIPVTVVMVP